jgi:hypothetical protein
MLRERAVQKSKSGIQQYSSGKSTKRATKIKDGGIMYRQIVINAKLKIVKRGQKIDLKGRSPLRGRRSALELVPSKKKNKISRLELGILTTESVCSTFRGVKFYKAMISADFLRTNFKFTFSLP